MPTVNIISFIQFQHFRKQYTTHNLTTVCHIIKYLHFVSVSLPPQWVQALTQPPLLTLISQWVPIPLPMEVKHVPTSLAF